MVQEDPAAQVLGCEDPPKRLRSRSAGRKKRFVAKQQSFAVSLRGCWARNAQELGPRFRVKNTLQARRKIKVDACLQVIGLSVVTRQVKSSTSSMNADDVTDARSRCEEPALEEPNPIDVESLGMDLMPQDLSASERFPRFAMPIILDELFQRLTPHLREYGHY